MHRLQSRALGIALGGAAFGGLIVGLTGAASASAATLNDGGYASGWVYTSTNATSGNQVESFPGRPTAPSRPPGRITPAAPVPAPAASPRAPSRSPRTSGHCWW